MTDTSLVERLEKIIQLNCSPLKLDELKTLREAATALRERDKEKVGCLWPGCECPNDCDPDAAEERISLRARVAELEAGMRDAERTVRAMFDCAPVMRTERDWTTATLEGCTIQLTKIRELGYKYLSDRIALKDGQYAEAMKRPRYVRTAEEYVAAMAAGQNAPRPYPTHYTPKERKARRKAKRICDKVGMLSDRLLDEITAAIQSAERETAAPLHQRIAELEAGLKWIADTPLQWTKSQNDIYWANVATAMAQSALDTLSKEP